jgi:hypothetical protein
MHTRAHIHTRSLQEVMSPAVLAAAAHSTAVHEGQTEQAELQQLEQLAQGGGLITNTQAEAPILKMRRNPWNPPPSNSDENVHDENVQHVQAQEGTEPQHALNDTRPNSSENAAASPHFTFSMFASQLSLFTSEQALPVSGSQGGEERGQEGATTLSVSSSPQLREGPAYDVTRRTPASLRL